MEITPLDIRKQEFKKSFSGYDKQEVENFLEMIAQQMEELIRENMSHKEQLRDVERKIDDYRRLEKTLQDTLTSATRTTEDLRKNAEQEGSIILKNAKLEAQNIVQTAKRDEESLRTEIKTLITMKNNFIAKFKGMIEAYSKLLEEETLDHKVDVNEINKIIKEHPESVSDVGSLFNRAHAHEKKEEPVRQQQPEQPQMQNESQEEHKENDVEENTGLGAIFKKTGN